MFDFANSAFTLIFHAYLFPLYLKESVFHSGTNTDLAWGLLLSVSALVAIVVAPFIGRIADHAGRWKVFAIIASLSFLSAILLSLLVGNRPFAIVAAFAIASTFFYLAANLYDSLLNSLVSGEEKPGFSGFAWGFGYLGGIACFLVVFWLQKRFGLHSSLPYLFTAFFYTVFGIAALAVLRKPLAAPRIHLRVSFRQMMVVMTRTRLGLLLGYFLIADTVGAVISFTSLYASDELHLSTSAIGGFLLSVQLLAVPLTFLICRVGTRGRTVRVLGFCTGVWIVILGLFVIRVNLAGMFVVTVLTAMVIGSTQALMRSHYSDLVEKDRDSELFGWYGVATESAAVVAPLLFGLASLTLDSKRLAMGLLIVPLCLGFFLVVRCSRRIAADCRF